MYDSSTAAERYSEVVPERLTALLQQVQQATGGMVQQTSHQRSRALMAMGEAILTERDRILEANTLDLEISREMAVPEQVTDWLKLTPERIHRVARILHRLGDLGSPFDLWMERRRPVGVVALVYESFPELGVLAAGLCLRTCNGLLLKGSNEASQTNQTLVDVLLTALATTDVSVNVVQLVPANWSDVTRAVFLQQPLLDLVIPHGRPKLIEQVAAQSVAPVISTYLGGCGLCVCPSADLEAVVEAVMDSHRGEPDAVNHIESLILVGEFDQNGLAHLWQRLMTLLRLKGSPELLQWFEPMATLATEQAQSPTYNRTLVIHAVATLSAAVDWLNAYGHGRPMGLWTALQDEVRQFTARANGVELYINTSPRFYRNPVSAPEIALGMSVETGRVGLKALTRPQSLFGV